MERVQQELRVDERTMLRQSLDFQRGTILLKVGGLTDAQLATPIPTSSLTLAGLLNHLAMVEDWWFRHVLLGVPVSQRWREVDFDADPEYEFRTAVEETGATLVARYEEACAASREAADSLPSLDSLSVGTSRRKEGGFFSLRWITLHMIEETARHAGHADLLREAIDGVTGE